MLFGAGKTRRKRREMELILELPRGWKEEIGEIVWGYKGKGVPPGPCGYPM